MLKRTIETLQKPLYVGIILIGITIAITLQSFLLGPKTQGGREYTNHNNYIIFKKSFFHLVENRDLYQAYPEEHWDYYKYSPTFALFMAPFVFLPDALGLFLWNGLNALVLFFALWKLPFQSGRTRLFVVAFVLIELITSLQNSQSNALIAGLIVFAFIFLERKQTALASLVIVSTVFIKFFGMVAFALFLFYPNKPRAIAYTIGWVVLFTLLPLLVIAPSQLSFLYQSWLDLLRYDHSTSCGLSVAGWLQSWFQLDFSKNVIVLLGAFLFCAPMVKLKFYQNLKFKLLFLASILIWVVIFNHKAESPTFVIAITGVAIWFFSQESKVENTVLLILAFVFTVLSPTDIFPKVLSDAYVTPYVLKAVPCILIWFKIIYDLTLFRSTDNTNESRVI